MRALTELELELVCGGYQTDGQGNPMTTVTVRGGSGGGGSGGGWPDWNPGWGGIGGGPGEGDFEGGGNGRGNDNSDEDPAEVLPPRQFGIGAVFATPEDAMKDAMKRLYQYSKDNNVEVRGIVQSDGEGRFYVDKLWKGDEDGVGKVQYYGEIVIDFHTHGAFVDRNNDGKDDYDSTNFSDEDKQGAHAAGQDNYMLDPFGNIHQYDISTGQQVGIGSINDPIAAPIEPMPGA